MTTCEACKKPKQEAIVKVTRGRLTGKWICLKCFCNTNDYMEGDVLIEEEANIAGDAKK